MIHFVSSYLQSLVYHENMKCWTFQSCKMGDSETLITTVVFVPANDGFVKNVVSGCLTEIWAPLGLSDNTMPLGCDGTLFLILTKQPRLYILFLLHKTSCNRGGDIMLYTLHLPDVLSSASEPWSQCSQDSPSPPQTSCHMLITYT